MHHDKGDFILGIQDWFSIQKSIHIINSIYRLRKKKNQTLICSVWKLSLTKFNIHS